MKEIDFDDLRVFTAVARRRNFRAAALDLRLSPAGLSQRVGRMETRLGVRLLNRTTRAVSLTQAGEHLLARVAPALADLDQAVADVRRGQGVVAGRLRITAPAPALTLVMAPMIAPFLAAYPDVELDIIAEPALIDIVAAGYDAGVRFEENLAEDMVAVSLGPPMRYALAAAPALLERVGTPREPSDLVGKPMIAVRFPNGVTLPWEFEKDGRTVRISPAGPLFATSPDIQAAAAIAGTGFIANFEGYLAEGLADGRLVRLLDDWLPPFSGPFLYYPSRRQPPPALAAFLDFVRAWRRREG